MSFILSDSRVIILLSLLFLTIIVAISLILFDKTRTKKEKIDIKDQVINAEIAELTRLINSVNSPEERLGIINHKAKLLFKNYFGIENDKSYSYLVKYFTSKNLIRYAMFCQDMFNLYYSKDRISLFDVNKVSKKLASLIELSQRIGDVKTPLRIVPVQVNTSNQNDLIFKKFWDSRNNKKHKNLPQKKYAKIVSQPQQDYNPLTQKQKEITQRIDKKFEEVKIQEHKNLMLLEETEEKLKQQQKLEIELHTKLRQQKEKEAIIEKQLKEGKIIEQKQLMLSKEACNIDKKWYHDVDAKPIMGKDWIKELKKKKNSNL